MSICACDREYLVVTIRHGNYSAFGGYRFNWSNYSEIRCLNCGGYFRSKAKYVERIRSATMMESTRSIPFIVKP